MEARYPAMRVTRPGGTNRSALFIWNRVTHAKISHPVASLPTSRQQVVFALPFASCQQVWNKLLTICNNLFDIIRVVARLFQQVQYSHDITIFFYNLVSSTL